MIKHLITLVFIFSLLVINKGMAQHYAEGELLVMLKKNIEVSKVIKELNQSHPGYNTHLKESISKELNVWLLGFDNVSVSTMNEVVKSHSQVEISQPNHTNIANRGDTIPTDVGFGNQWHHLNTGGFGGLIGADISSTQAWGISNTNVTPLGDTLVVAVIDDGFFLNHVDIDFFTNRSEIPGNGIDDDGNGYIDDVQGWNSTLSNGTITSEDHGTHVAGIAGAKANNGFGGVGVNWGVKILPIQNTSASESSVLRAYGYALAMRKLYDQSAGAQGAFVVVTNSSFGIDNAFESSFPLWCAFYDSLGASGILSCGATSNNNNNVDATGDIPTTCTSDYLISVTNTNSSDVKVTSGFGAVNIDIGAPGSFIYSTTPGNSFGFRSGTSMSTPMLAGAVALMHSIGCANFATVYKNNPDSMALVIKNTILNFGDSLFTLQGITVTGNRLNTRKAGYEIRTGGACSLTSLPKIPQQEGEIVLFPNPTNNQLNVTFTGYQKGEYSLQLFSIEGKLIKDYSFTISSDSQTFSQELDSQTDKGVYLLCVKSAFSSPKTIRFVVSD